MTQLQSGLPIIRNQTGVLERPLVGASNAIIEQIESLLDPNPLEEIVMSNGNYDADVLVLGAGPGGYVAAIRAAQIANETGGGKVICVEREYLGGTCLNWGCIPSKVMIANAERYHQTVHAKEMGVLVSGEVSYDFDAMQARKDKIVQTLRGGIGSLFKKHKVQSVEGEGKMTGRDTVEVTAADGSKQTFRAKNVILATGSRTIRIPIPGLEGENVWTSDDAVYAKFVPESMLILGAGAVGLEFAYVFNALGAKVTVVEMAPQVLPLFDAEIAKEAEKSLSRQGITLITSATLKSAERRGFSWFCQVEGEKGSQEVEAQVVLLGVGRRPNTENIGLDVAGVQMDKNLVAVDEYMRTNVPNIYAIGDIVGKYPLAHVASAQGILVAENCFGASRRMDYRAVPNVVYTHPEVASVGLTEAQAREQGYDVKIGKFLPRALGRSMAVNEKDGLVKVVAESRYGEILGVHICSAHASDLLQEAVLAIKLEATLDDLVDTIHPHPTMVEALMEAFHDAAGHSVHK
ncbi:MAG: dihydrolipoyl dehydrogenase [Fimbriimonadia bacterium]|nr:dihydrolipoyl dehydrogenase [Fimbriimonadia bacterium]